MEIDNKLYVVMEPREASVQGNNRNKLQGSDGQTLVFWHRNIEGTADETTRKTVAVMDRIQATLVTNLGQKVAEEGDFVSLSRGEGVSENAAFVPIENLHTTVSAQYVVDSHNDEEWNASVFKTQMRLSANRLSFEERAIFNEQMEQIEEQMKAGTAFFDALKAVETNPVVQKVIDLARSPAFVELVEENHDRFKDTYEGQTIRLTPNALKVVPNGAVLVEWDGGEAMRQLKRDVAALGGTLKYGTLDNPPPNVGTTLGFIPGFDQMTSEEKDKLETLVAQESQQLATAELHLSPKDHLHSVSFRRNDLAPTFSSWCRAWEANSIFARQPTAIDKPKS